MDRLINFFISFKGRIPREQFWLGFGAVLFVSLAIQLVPVFGALLGLALLWPQCAVHAKRLHDMGWSGWTLLAPFGAAFACGVAVLTTGGRELIMVRPGDTPPLFMPGYETPSWFLALAGFIQIGFLIWVGATAGEKQANKYGPPPGDDKTPREFE